MASDFLIKNYTWDEITSQNKEKYESLRGMESTGYQWIKNGDDKYQYLSTNVINRTYPLLRQVDKDLLLYGLVTIINFIRFKFGFGANDKNDSIFWQQLIQNGFLDARALIGIMLPFINDNEKDDNKHNLRKLSELYLAKDDRGNYIYTNSQYNRCVRYKVGDKIEFYKRPYLKEYFLQHLNLLLMGIETISNKLYVNWVDIVPIKMTEYENLLLFKNTFNKLIGEPNRKINTVALVNNYIDPSPGLSYQDIYNTISNHLFQQIKNHKWLIYDLVVNATPVAYINYLGTKIRLDNLWQGRYWTQLEPAAQNAFVYDWNNFMNSIDILDNTVLHHFYFFFSKYHRNAQNLINTGQLILTKDNLSVDEEEEEENVRITPEKTRDAKRGLQNVPVEEIYLFFLDQLDSFKTSWYYYILRIKKQQYLAKDGNIFVTAKNIYNYSKSMVHYVNSENKFMPMPRYWISLKPKFINILMYRLLNIIHPTYNDWSRNNWFNINNYIRRIYPNIPESDLVATNERISNNIRLHLVNIIFESLIYHGLLSDFRPQKLISDNIIVQSAAGNNEKARERYKRSMMKKYYFTGQEGESYSNNSYYYLTGTTYGELNFKYFDFLSENQIWTFTYAMNWVSQINFFHHYLNDRVIYITGATGVGKSTQVPKLFMYGQKMIDFNIDGKIICTQPRVEPTVNNAETISRELGVPIKEYSSQYNTNVLTTNYYVQFKHQKEQHTDQIRSFLRIVTDGTLFEEVINSPFLTKSVKDDAVGNDGDKKEWARIFRASNIYDIIIVDEAHEHNPNMDMILTLARDSAYVNNSLKIIIISATMEDDEPIYRRYYRLINDNRAYPPSAFIENQELDRANMDRRIHISEPGATTRHKIVDHFLSEEESSKITAENFVDAGINKTIEVINSTTDGDLLLFMSGQADIKKSVPKINENTPGNVITFGYYGELTEEQKVFIREIHITLPKYTRFKEDTNLDEKDITRRVPEGTYTRAVIVATNVAEASITLVNLRYVVDTGYAKVKTFDPLDKTSKLITMPISWSSSQQRRGRVGRVAPGVVYYLYSKEKIINNKTAYKIADINIMDMLLKLIKSDPDDSHIITDSNDINNIRKLESIKNINETKIYEPDYLIYKIFNNPRPYLDIIRKQYLYSPDPTNVEEYYSYYGKADWDVFDQTNLKNNINQYFLDNHDDYQFQANEKFLSRAYTGYDDYILADKNLSFYLIHPDENIIIRNLYTGQMVGFKCKKPVTPEYCYFFLRWNDIYDDIDKPDFNKIDFTKIDLPKYYLAMENAKLQQLVVEIPPEYIDFEIRYPNINDVIISRNIELFYNYNKILLDYYNSGEGSTVKSQFLLKMNEIKSAAKVKVFNDDTYNNNYNNLLWYVYSIPYGVENDSLALMIMMFNVPDISKWIGTIKSRRDIQTFYFLHTNDQGDVYFIWKIWKNIKDALENSNLLQYTKIENYATNFEQIKNKYANKGGVSQEELKLFNRLYQSGQLGSEHEFYYFMKQYSFDFTDLILKSNIIDYLTIIANNNKLNPEHLIKFIVDYLNSLFEINRGKWIKKYKIENNLAEEDEIDIFEWAKTKLLFPNIIRRGDGLMDEWDNILEAYLRAFSTNVIKYGIHYYINITSGTVMEPSFWSQRLKYEKTFLKNKMEYLVYNTEQSTEDESTVSYLTPVKLEWIFDLNPIYYYNYFYDNDNLLKQMAETGDEDAIVSYKLITENKNLFNTNALISYLDQIDNKQYSKIIRNKLLSQK